MAPVTACLGSWGGAPSVIDKRDRTYLCCPLGTFSAPWAALARSREQYCLAWEAKYLMELGNALETILSGLANMVAQEALKYTVLSGKPPYPAPRPTASSIPTVPSPHYYISLHVQGSQ